MSTQPEGRKRNAVDLLQEVVRLREVNADLLAALEWFSNRFHTNAEVAKQWAGSCSMSTAEWQDWEARVAAAIAKAKLPA